VKRPLLLLAFAASIGAQPRPINDAERAAVTIAASFLAQGAPAIYEKLATDAPLRALPKEDALREIEARTGPHAGAKWSLQTTSMATDAAFHVTFPSGADDGLLFRMNADGTIRELRTLAEGAMKTPAPVEPKSIRGALLIAAIVLALLAALFGRIRMIALLLAAIALGFAIHDPPIRPRMQLVAQFVELRELAPLRASIARGGVGRIPNDLADVQREIATLWLGKPVPNNKSVLGELVHARHALASDRAAEAQSAFQRAIDLAPRDDIFVEAAYASGGSESSFALSDRLSGIRDAAWYYARARLQRPADLQTAWRLRPIPRDELVADDKLFPLLRDVRTLSTVSLLAANEPVVRSAQLSSTPIALPPNARAFVCGEFLRISIGDATLDVHGGAALAPKNAQLVAATHWQREEDAAALRDAEAIINDRTLANPFRLAKAANALAHHNRWPELIKLTDDITPQDTNVAPELLVQRLTALLRANRMDDARALAEGNAMRRINASGPLLAIADAMAAIGNFDHAASLYRNVRGSDYQPLIEMRIRQLELRRALVANGKMIATQHFDIRHDPNMNPAIASRIGDLLEAELARLRSKFPPVALRRIVVNVLYWDDFRGNITGSDHILGLYDGEILFPFAVVHQFKPEVVSIITHELTHALVAQATGDNAPRWFQEGVAQRMELVPYRANSFYETPAGQVLPVSLLDAVMSNAADPQTLDQGYRLAHTFVRYLEHRHGEQAINKLIAAFAKGTNTDDALTSLTGKSFDAINKDFREWGFANNANFTSDEPWPYAHLYSPGIDPRVREGFKWGKRPPSP
jgi:tetratricopeptide (TPR) repeat protein